MSYRFMKCDDSGNPNSCENIINDLRKENVCKYIPMKGQTWTPFVERLDKKLSCPVQPVSENRKFSPIFNG